MSRGWESKSVEEQQAERAQQAEQSFQPDTQPDPQPLAASAPVPRLRNNNAADAEQKRRIQALELQRERVLSERTSSPHRRSALGAALDSIEEELAQLGWTIHL